MDLELAQPLKKSLGYKPFDVALANVELTVLRKVDSSRRSQKGKNNNLQIVLRNPSEAQQVEVGGAYADWALFLTPFLRFADVIGRSCNLERVRGTSSVSRIAGAIGPRGQQVRPRGRPRRI